MAGMLEGKSALITGGGGGIGRATAVAFAREGARVAVADVVTGAAEQTVASINQAGGQAMSLTGDITVVGCGEGNSREGGRHIWPVGLCLQQCGDRSSAC
jgi:NAD(P)-dependent dehydrogenase (short-subunit alcohol dehydrogenase family)